MRSQEQSAERRRRQVWLGCVRSPVYQAWSLVGPQLLPLWCVSGRLRKLAPELWRPGPGQLLQYPPAPVWCPDKDGYTALCSQTLIRTQLQHPRDKTQSHLAASHTPDPVFLRSTRLHKSGMAPSRKTAT